ncbi:MAG: YeeE/YedE family protein, partial [Deltaproteobacteria bacterium]|nr:YeeE/YedE family protein [Deltaproteobacteria bacterium]
VTAMLGLMVASGVGLIELRALSEAAASYTYMWPMLVGGLMLGAGFIISGYCPGTSVVATASGNLDGLFTFVGVVAGSLIYGEIQPLVAGFHDSGEKGHLFLYDVLGVPAPVLAAAVAVMAVLMFVGAEKVERKFTRKRLGGKEPEPPPKRPRRYAFAAIGVLVALALGALAFPVGTEAAPQRAPRQLGPEELAHRLIDEPWTLRILDLRARESCAKSRVPTSACSPLAKIDELGLPYGSGARDLVLVYSVAPHEGRIPAAALDYPGELLVLDGGFAAWREYALSKPPVPGPQASETEREAYRFRAALVGAMTGRKPPPPPAANPSAVPKKKKKKGGGCG